MIKTIKDYNIEYKDIEGYEGLYAITIDGRVWSYKSNKFLIPYDMGKGYLYVGLCKDGKKKDYRLHRLVALAFIPNPENKPQVSHLDENPKNNHVSNLAWATAKENNNYGSHIEKIAKAVSKPVYCVELDTVFPSRSAAADELGVSLSTVCNTVNGKQKAAKGYHLISVSLGDMDKKLNYMIDSLAEERMTLDKETIMNIRFRELEKKLATAM